MGIVGGVETTKPQVAYNTLQAGKPTLHFTTTRRIRATTAREKIPQSIQTAATPRDCTRSPTPHQPHKLHAIIVRNYNCKLHLFCLYTNSHCITRILSSTLRLAAKSSFSTDKRALQIQLQDYIQPCWAQAPMAHTGRTRVHNTNASRCTTN